MSTGVWAPYLAIFDSRAREELQYRAAAVAGLVTQVVFGFIFLMVLTSFYASSSVSPPLSVPETVVYVWLGQALLGLLPWNVDPAARRTIRMGDVALELLRPIEAYRFWFVRALAWRVVRTFLRFVPMVAIAGFLLPVAGLVGYAMPAPASRSAAVLFLLAVASAALLSTAVTILIQIAMIWTVSPDGLLRMVPSVVVFLSGGLLPLPLFPGWMQPLLALQPLRGLVDTPARIYAGDLVGHAAVEALALGVAWLIVLTWVGRWTLARGLHRMVVAGG